MNEELFESIMQDAIALYKEFNRGIKGQQMSITDNMSYSIALAAYKKGQGDGIKDIMSQKGYQPIKCEPIPFEPPKKP